MILFANTILVTAIVLFVLAWVGVGAWLYVRARTGDAGLKRAWELWKTDPDAALKLFDKALSAPKVKRDKKQRSKVQLSRTICFLKKHDFDAAYQAEQEA